MQVTTEAEAFYQSYRQLLVLAKMERLHPSTIDHLSCMMEEYHVQAYGTNMEHA